MMVKPNPKLDPEVNNLLPTTYEKTDKKIFTAKVKVTLKSLVKELKSLQITFSDNLHGNVQLGASSICSHYV